MSALSDVDLRDFERVDVDVLEKRLQEGATYTLEPFIVDYCDTLRRIQKKLIQQTPALFKP